MTALLLRAKAQTRFGGTRDKVTRLIRLTLQTGLLTTLLALSGLGLMLAGLSYFDIFWIALTKSYAISLFANLNARSRQRTISGDNPVGLSNVGHASSNPTGAGEAPVAM